MSQDIVTDTLDGLEWQRAEARRALEAMRRMALRTPGEWAAEIARRCDEALAK